MRGRVGSKWLLVPAMLAACCAWAAAPAGAHAKAKPKTTVKQTEMAGDGAGWWPSSDVEDMPLTFGPFTVEPGQNNIKFAVVKQRPTVAGWIVSFKPNLVYTKNGVCPKTFTESQVPAVDVIHLHHGVWLINGYPSFAAGEEKTRAFSPKGFGYPYSTSDNWALTYMIHNLRPTVAHVCLTYDLGFIPATAPAAKSIVAVHTQWMDVRGISVYPVFDVHQGTGTNGRFTYPTQDPSAYAPGQHLNQWTVPEDQTIVGMVGHLHPGGLYDSMYDTRTVNGVKKTVLLFRSRAHYFEPAGTVSWDVAMLGTPADYRVSIKKGDVISVTGTYDTQKSSWYESMAIMPMQVAVGGTGLDPFTHDVAVPGVLNHGHLAENDNHGGGSPTGDGYINAVNLPNGPLTDAGTVAIAGFVYAQGDMNLPGPTGTPPTIHQGQSLTFVNNDANVGPGEWHTITSCQAPCTGPTGIAYPLANQAPGLPSFDSGELGTGGPPTAGRTTWSTPATLPAGTYTYFCRIHPFMRGSFRVLPAQ